MKTLYIGIGGNGVKTLAAIKRKMDSYEQFSAARGQQINNNDEFLFLDTDTKDIQEIPNVDLTRDFVSLNTTPATQYEYERTHVSDDANRFFDWYDPLKTGLSPHPLNTGAGAIRMDGRLGLYAHKTDYLNRLRNKLTILNAVAGDANLRALPMNVYVFSGTSGGTGSGILLDVLMGIDKIYTGIVGDPNRAPSVTLFLFGPDQTYTIETDADAANKKARNGAACLYELDAFKRCTIKKPLGSHRIFNRFSGWVNGLQLTSPFHFPKYVYYLDNTLAATGLNVAQTVSYKVMHDLAADFVFNMEVGKLNKFNELAGIADVVGISQLDSLLVNGNQNNIDQNGFCQMFSTFAPLSVCFPKELFSRYCRTRFNVECFKVLRGSETVDNIDAKKLAFKQALDTRMAILKDSVKGIFDNAEKSKKTVASGICVNDTEHRIIYDSSAAPKLYGAMAPVVAQAKNDIKDWIYRHFAEMLQTEGVAGVTETVMACDVMLTALSAQLKNEVVSIPKPGFMQWDTNYYNDVLECINKLLEIEIYDYCSLGNNGVLDHVTTNLEALRIAFRVKLEKCLKDQGSFIGTLNAEINNPMRQYLPRLDTILQDSRFVEGNEFERTYDNAFTDDYTRRVRQQVYADAQIQQEILSIVSFEDQDRATGVVVAMAEMVDELFSKKFANDQIIQNYAQTEILNKINRLPVEQSNRYQTLIKGHEGALFPTNDAVLHAHGHMVMVLADFNNNATIRGQYLPSPNDIAIDDAYFADRVVSFYVTNGLSIDDINSLHETYLPFLRNEVSTHPAFSDKRFDIKPFQKESIYDAMAGGSVELSIDLLSLLMLSLLDVKAGRVDLYTAGDMVNGTVTCNGTTCDYSYQILGEDRSIVLAFPTFFNDPVMGIQMNAYPTVVGRNYAQGQRVIQETKDCYNYILKGTISNSDIESALPRLKSMLGIRLNDNDLEYLNFASLYIHPRYKHNFITLVIEENIKLL